jgi:hypothetical protein
VNRPPLRGVYGPPLEGLLEEVTRMPLSPLLTPAQRIPAVQRNFYLLVPKLEIDAVSRRRRISQK